MRFPRLTLPDAVLPGGLAQNPFQPATVNAPSFPAGSQMKLLILSVSAGAGHVRAAEAICAGDAWQRTNCLHLDVMEVVPAVYRKLYTDAYIGLVNRYPAVWGWIYRTTDRARPNSIWQRLRRFAEQTCTRRLLRIVRELQPDAIVCTHFLPAEILAHATNQACPLWIQVTDFDLHRAWIHPRVAGYFAANDEVAFRMRAGGIPANSIHVTGIPIMPAFSTRLDREDCAREFGLDPSEPTLLLMGGGAGIGGLCEVAERLLGAVPGFQLVVMAGRNREALAALNHLALQWPRRLFPQPFTDRVERLMACADLAVTKPGGLSTSECLAQGLPMILHAPVPGQEERNAEYLLEQGVALKAADATALEFRVRELLANPARLAAMRACALSIARPAAAADVVHVIHATTLIKPS